MRAAQSDRADAPSSPVAVKDHPTNVAPPINPPAPRPWRGQLYVWSIVTLAAALVAGAGAIVRAAGSPALLVGVVVTLVALPAIQVSSMVVHLVLRAALRPSAPVPASPVAPGGPELAVTCFVYPVIVHDTADIDALVATMRDSRKDSGAGFAAHIALVDFADSRTPQLDTDNDLRTHTHTRLAAASRAQPGPPLLALFRSRRWNGADWTWMGWERKRGKLLEFVDLISGSTTTSFEVDDAGSQQTVDRLLGIRYVITLDVGNRLLTGGARRLVAAISHPDNRPIVDRATGRVLSGFGFIRPCHVPARPRTLFEWAWQPYSSPSGQASFGRRLFGQDLFLGQGIFDASAFRAGLTGQIPENSVLSHDKLEGMHIGAACIAEAVIVEGNVGDYLAYRERSHRWIRGDVHLVPWVLTRGRSGRRALPMVARWMLLSDVVDHLWPLGTLALLTLGWLAAPVGHVGTWTIAVVGLLFQAVLVLPLMVMAGRLPRRPAGLSRPKWLKAHLAVRARLASWLVGVELLRAPIWIALLADRAILSTDAAVRAAYRGAISNRYVLQWTSAARAGRGVGGTVAARWRRMGLSCGFAVVLAVAIAVVNPAALPWAAPLLTLWFVAPHIAYWTSQPARRLPFASLSNPPGE